jgi:hypothetical protein
VSFNINSQIELTAAIHQIVEDNQIEYRTHKYNKVAYLSYPQSTYFYFSNHSEWQDALQWISSKHTSSSKASQEVLASQLTNQSKQ